MKIYYNVASKNSGKLSKVRRRGYVRVEGVNSLTRYFLVIKGEYIRIVCIETYISLNTSLWGTHFALPTIGSALCAVEKGTFMAHQYIGEMFLNFILSEEVRQFYGVGVTNELEGTLYNQRE